jgi:hypothetical protein
MASEYQCETCGARYWRNMPGPCFADGCSGRLKRVPKKRVTAICEICARPFFVKGFLQRACDGRCTVELRKRENRARTLNELRRAKEEELRKKRLEEKDGECWEYSTPLTNMRKCHTCKKPTWNYNCDKCKAKMKATEGATGTNSESELFSGGVVEAGLV